MGKTLLILLVGFSASFGILARSKNERMLASIDRMVDHFGDYATKNASTSGVYLALNRLYRDPAWRAGYNHRVLAGNAFSVTVEDHDDDATLGSHYLRIRSSSSNVDAASLTEVTVFDSPFHKFAVWAKDTVISIAAEDSLGGENPNLIIQNAPFMPKIDYGDLIDGLVAAADDQGHVQTEEAFKPDDDYPNGNFYYFGLAPNVTHVKGNLRVEQGLTVYGIFIVEGNAQLESGATVEGVLYFPNASSRLVHHGSGGSESLVKGGVVTWGYIDGSGGDIVVQHFPVYLRKFVSNYAPSNPPIRVLSWK